MAGGKENGASLLTCRLPWSRKMPHSLRAALQLPLPAQSSADGAELKGVSQLCPVPHGEPQHRLPADRDAAPVQRVGAPEGHQGQPHPPTSGPAHSPRRKKPVSAPCGGRCERERGSGQHLGGRPRRLHKETTWLEKAGPQGLPVADDFTAEWAGRLWGAYGGEMLPEALVRVRRTPCPSGTP